MDASDLIFIKQHLIDPEICIRCNTCEATCPVGAITHDDRNYVVRADVCNLCTARCTPCTGCRRRRGRRSCARRA